MSASSTGIGCLVVLVAYWVFKRQQQRSSSTAKSASVAASSTPASAAASSAPAARSSAVAGAASSSSRPTPAAAAAASRSSRSSGSASSKLKMVLVVRGDLGMGKGKMMAQCCHAAVGVVREMMEAGDDDDDEETDGASEQSSSSRRSWAEDVERWDNNGAMKIALKANSEAELDALEAQARAQGLPCYLVIDAGHTQIAPDSKTVLAIGPAQAMALDQITGHLKLM